MENFDIGIDLGTTNVVIYNPRGELLLKEPSVLAINTYTGRIIAVGNEAHNMLGKTPDRIRAITPLSDGVISDFDMTREMITRFIRKIYAGKFIKPRVIVCVPSNITEVEGNAVISASLSAGARKVYLIEEPIAAAIGAGIDISLPIGNAVIDIGGGTSDVAILSFNGVVCKNAIKIAGRRLDESIIKYVRANYGILIGEKMAEKAKISAASALFLPHENITTTVKGRDLQSGLPKSLIVTREELSGAIAENIELIVRSVRQILEVTPPELAADLSTTGLIMTGGTSQLHGLADLLSKETGLPVRVAENPSDCVAIGTAKAFGMIDDLFDGLIKATTYNY